MSNYAKNPNQNHAAEVNSIPPKTLIGYLHQVNETGMDRLLALPIGLFPERDALLNYIGEELEILTATNTPWPRSIFSLFNITEEDLLAYDQARAAEEYGMFEDQGLGLHPEPSEELGIFDAQGSVLDPAPPEDRAPGFKNGIHYIEEIVMPQEGELIDPYPIPTHEMHQFPPHEAAVIVLFVLGGIRGGGWLESLSEF